MSNMKPPFIFLFGIVVITLFSYRNFRNTSPTISKTIPSSFSSSSKTCLQSFNDSRIYRSLFHTSMVSRAAPSSIKFWVENKTGFEIGGPSQYTWGNMGVYDVAAKVDVTNFASTTLWESGLKDGLPFKWNNNQKGIQYIRDGVDLHGIGNETYDFVLASHALEHIANPFKALLEWIRILRKDGILLLILPFKYETFDHKRDVARIEHLIDDYHRQINESDLSHLDEILRLHDLPRDPPAGNIDTFKARSMKNFENRGLHQHVYDQELLYRIFICLNLEIKLQATWSNNDLIIGQKI